MNTGLIYVIASNVTVENGIKLNNSYHTQFVAILIVSYMLNINTRFNRVAIKSINSEDNS